MTTAPGSLGRGRAIFRPLCLILGLTLLGLAPGRQAQADTISPRPDQDVASGSSSTTRFFYVGGIANLGLFVGQPNALTRNDRALLRFDLAPYAVRTRGPAPARRATLTFHIGTFQSPESTRTLEISHAREDLLVFSEFDLVRKTYDKIGTLTIDRAKADYTIDVTDAINNDLRQGNLFAAFRLRDVGAEAHGNLTGDPTGMVITREGQGRPCLEITLKDDCVVSTGTQTTKGEGK